jgi:hypothetical protein
VALPAQRVSGKNYEVTYGFCREHRLSLCVRGHSVRWDDQEFVVFCFADADHAEIFREAFGGKPFDVADRGRGRAWHQWRKR